MGGRRAFSHIGVYVFVLTDIVFLSSCSFWCGSWSSYMAYGFEIGYCSYLVRPVVVSQLRFCGCLWRVRTGSFVMCLPCVLFALGVRRAARWWAG